MFKVRLFIHPSIHPSILCGGGYNFHLRLSVLSLRILSQLDRVIFVVWSDKDKFVYESLIPEYFPPTEDVLSIAAVAEEGIHRKEEEDVDSEGEPVPESQVTVDDSDEWEEVQKVEGNVAENGDESQKAEEGTGEASVETKS